MKAPVISGTKLANGLRTDRPLTVSIEAPDGATQAQAFLYRSGAAGEQQWNPARGLWQAAVGDEALGSAVEGLALSAAGPRWTLPLDPAALRDANGEPQFSHEGGFQYFAKIVATPRVVSPPSPAVALVRLAGLALPAPALRWPGGGAQAPIEKPVDVALPPLLLPDGEEAKGDAIVKLGVLVERDGGQFWHEKAMRWQAAAADAEALATLEPPLEPLALEHKPGDARRWQGQLVALGQKDGADAPRYLPTDAGGPAYRLRAFALVQRAGVVYLGLGPPSTDLRFVRMAGKEHFGMQFDTEGPSDCSEVRLRLRDSAGQTAGYLRMALSPREAELVNCNAAGQVLARVRLTAQGDIEIQPAPGRRVLVLGDLEAERIRYQPSGGGGKTDLNWT
ncbi:MAG: hypothetical protein KF720_14510 [Rubrivivax sp.]|nr:hypothetical protein [Rubrivivax sp.]